MFTEALKEENGALWERSIGHPFVKELGKFTLPLGKFKVYIEQDYQYLLGFIKSLGLFLAKSNGEEDIIRFKELVDINLQELELHRKNYGLLGYKRKELTGSEPSLVTKSYVAYLLSQGYERTGFELLGSTLACDWLYADIGKELIKNTPEPADLKDRIYKRWIENYASKKYQDDVLKFRQRIDTEAEKVGKTQLRGFRGNFSAGLRFEHAFWSSIYYSSDFEELICN